MSTQSSPDGTRDAVRSSVDAVKRAIDGLPSQPDADAHARLLSAWGQLVDRLALGPAPELRACPTCGNLIMAAATLCGHCWKRPPAL